MKSVEVKVITSAMLIPLGFGLIVTSEENRWLFIAGLIGIIAGLIFLNLLYKQLTVKEEKEEQLKKASGISMQTLINEVRELRQDLSNRGGRDDRQECTTTKPKPKL